MSRPATAWGEEPFAYSPDSPRISSLDSGIVLEGPAGRRPDQPTRANLVIFCYFQAVRSRHICQLQKNVGL